MYDAKVVAACIASREAYDKVRSFVSTQEFTPMAGFWWDLVEEWYKADSAAGAVDPQLLRDKGARACSDAHHDTMLGWYDELPDQVSSLNVVADLLEVKRFAKGNELSVAMHENRDVKKIKRLLSEYDNLITSSELGGSKLQYAVAGEDLFGVMSNENKWSLSPSVLNDRTDGGCLPGDFIILFGRKEMGKTLFCVQLVCHWLRQNARVLYIGNEDKIDKIKWRMLCNLSNMTKEQILKFKDEALSRARKKGFDDRLFMVHLHPGTVSEIEELVVEHEPDILVIDQVRNIGGGGDGLTARMNQVAIDIRQLTSKYQLVTLGVAQAHAGEHGRPKVWLANDDIDSSRTGLPAQGDLILGIGADETMIAHNTRALSIPTNKISGDHDGFIYTIDKQRNKVL